MTYNLFGKEIRGRFGFPSGEIATTSDTARRLLNSIPQLGWYVGKSTTIEPRNGHREDVFVLPDKHSGWNAIGYANPGIKVMVEAFRELGESVPDDVFLMPQIGEYNEMGFEHCAEMFDRVKRVDAIELNVSCPHADHGGILIGADPVVVGSIVMAARKATKKPLIVKLNAGVDNIVTIAKAALQAGADGISAINTLGGHYRELRNQFGGLSGDVLFPTTYRTVKRLRNHIDVPMIVMGGIRGASDIRILDDIDSGFFYGIGTALAEMDENRLKEYFMTLDRDFESGTDLARDLVQRKALQYEPSVVREIVDLSPTLKLFKFDTRMDAGIGQYVFLKVRDHSKPFSVADDTNGLELLIRNVGRATSRIFELEKNAAVRIRGPYGREFNLSKDKKVIFVGAGCGIAPINHASKHHKGLQTFILGARTASELAYAEELGYRKMVLCSTDDGSKGHQGLVTELLERYLQEEKPNDPIFFNCGPEIVLKKADAIERNYTKSENIYHLVERMTSCGVGICGKCSTPEGYRACVDGPVFTAEEFTPGLYTRDMSGTKVPL